MQSRRLLSPVLLICFVLFLATSVSCSKLDSSVEVTPASNSKDDTVTDHLALDLELESAGDTDESAPETEDRPTYQSPSEEKKAEVQTIEIPSSWRRLSKEHEIWIDNQAKEVIVAGEVCLNQGPLEMFICPQGTKEHESVISANALSNEVHGALIFLGADPGKACSWDPDYRPAYGPTIEIKLMWQDPSTKQTKTQSAREWIRNVKTQKPLAQAWVFGGSEFWKDPDTKQEVYYGDSGEMVCLSNFSTATIDLNVESSDSNAGLLFEAFTENIPPLGTKVYAIIKPGKRIEPAKQNEPPSTAADDSEPAANQSTENKSDGSTGKRDSGDTDGANDKEGSIPATDRETEKANGKQRNDKQDDGKQ